MATKKAAPKKQTKAAPPAKKAPAKPVQKGKAPVKKAAPASKKPAPKKSAPAAKKAAPKKQALAPKKAVAKVTKPAPKKPLPAPAKKAPAKPAPKPIAKKAAPAKTVEPVKKPAVSAKSQSEVKPTIKPITKSATPPAPVKKEAPKPAKPIVIPKTSTTRSVKYEPDFMKSVLDKKQAIENGPTQRYSDNELAEFRDLINRKLDTAKKELAYLQGLITRKDESGDLDEGRYMTMEDGSMSMEREQLSQMASRQIQFIDHLEKAIMRIENKTYGICRVTGKLIDKARLRAVPHATLSIEAKQMMNK